MTLMQKLEETKDRIEHQFGRKVLAVFPAGSQTRQMALPESDLDLIVVVFPSMQDLFLSRQVSEKLEKEDIEIKDVRNFFQMLKKQNPAVLTVLNSSEGLLDLDYCFLVDNSWRVYDVFRCTMAVLAMTFRDLTAAENKPEQAAKYLSRAWYNLDTAAFLAQYQYYPRPDELTHAGQYLQVKQQNLSVLQEVFGKDPSVIMREQTEALRQDILQKKINLRGDPAQKSMNSISFWKSSSQNRQSNFKQIPEIKIN